MINERLQTFMALVPLMVPSLITSPSEDDLEVSSDHAYLYFPFSDQRTLASVVDTCCDGLGVVQLYYATFLSGCGVRHCCLFTPPASGRVLYKVNLVSDSVGMVDGMSVTIFDSVEFLEQALEDDLSAHSDGFRFEHALTVGDVLSLFCKMM